MAKNNFSLISPGDWPVPAPVLDTVCRGVAREGVRVCLERVRVEDLDHTGEVDRSHQMVDVLVPDVVAEHQ